jgi:hypothetical protein
MRTSWTTIIDDVQGYLAHKIGVMPHVFVDFLRALSDSERAHQVCLLPIARFELYHHNLEQKVRARIRRRQQRAA